MIYLSKGMVKKGSTEHLLQIARCGQEYRLSGEEAALWLRGRFRFSEPETESEKRSLLHLKRMGLAETEEDTAAGKYRILTQCVCCPAVCPRPEMLLGRAERETLRWLRDAGLRLTAAELVFLKERGIRPELGYLHAENRQKLVEAIYTADTIGDSLLENLMEGAGSRDEVVELLMGLLKKKRILIL